MRLRVLLTTLVLFSGTSLAQGASPLVGTWQVVFCKERPCAVGDTTNVVLSGTLMFSDSAIDLTNWSPEARRYRGTRGAGGFIRSTLNACFELATHRVAEVTYAGIGGAGLIHWEGTAANASVLFYQSPDARAVGTLTAYGDSLFGQARSSAAGSWATPKQDDIIVGRRIGGWDPTKCAAAVDRQANRDIASPPFGRAVDSLPAAIDTTRRYIIAFVDDSLPQSPVPLRSTMRVRVLFSPRLLEDATLVLTVVDSVENAVARGAEQLRRLLAASVPSSRISILGVGGGTAPALELARRAAEPLGLALIGSCPRQSTPAPRASRSTLLSRRDVGRNFRRRS
jgi:hypothetical protein